MSGESRVPGVQFRGNFPVLKSSLRPHPKVRTFHSGPHPCAPASLFPSVSAEGPTRTPPYWVCGEGSEGTGPKCADLFQFLGTLTSPRVSRVADEGATGRGSYAEDQDDTPTDDEGPLYPSPRALPTPRVGTPDVPFLEN